MADDRQPIPGRAAPRHDTATLIAHLAHDVAPVRRIWSPRARLALWLAVEALVAGAALLVLGERPDLALKLRSTGFATELGMLVATGVGSALLALLAAVPGREPARAVALGSSVAVVAALAALHASAVASPLGSAAVLEGGWGCAMRTLAVATVPWLFLLLAVRRGATLVPARAGALAGAATLLVAAAVIRVVCPSDERWHLLVYHLGPVVLGIAASVAIGLSLLRRWRRG